MYLMKEAINLICIFYTHIQGIWKDDIMQYSEVIKFIDDGYTLMDIKYPDLYVPNDSGYDILHTYIKDISMQFIEMMKSRHFKCLKLEITQWFREKYELDDILLAEEISDYIIKNLHNYGYKYILYTSSKKGEYYEIVPLVSNLDHNVY